MCFIINKLTFLMKYLIVKIIDACNSNCMTYFMDAWINTIFMSFPNFNEGTNLVVLIWKTKLRSAIQALEKQDIIILIIFLHFYDSVLMCCFQMHKTLLDKYVHINLTFFDASSLGINVLIRLVFDYKTAWYLFLRATLSLPWWLIVRIV